MVGATEFLIRGPFYTEGLLQGLFGSVVAAGSLLAGHTVLQGADVAESLLGELLLREFLSPSQLALLIGIGCGAAKSVFGSFSSTAGRAPTKNVR